jgi:hypothetical protein
MMIKSRGISESGPPGGWWGAMYQSKQ